MVLGTRGAGGEIGGEGQGKTGERGGGNGAGEGRYREEDVGEIVRSGEERSQ